MADTKIAYQEVRFDVRDPELTQVYVYIENLSNDGFPVQGWHHKTFSAKMSSIEILQGKGAPYPRTCDFCGLGPCRFE